jgi:hypothetical protein
MTKKKVLPFVIAGTVLVVILLDVLFWKISDTTFSNYNNNTVLGSATPPKSFYNQKGFIAGTKDSSTLFSVRDIKLSGIEDIFNTNYTREFNSKFKMHLYVFKKCVQIDSRFRKRKSSYPFRQ